MPIYEFRKKYDKSTHYDIEINPKIKQRNERSQNPLFSIASQKSMK